MTDYVTQQLGNYRLVRHLGRGGFADVYLGIHIHLKTQAAIKVLHTELTSSDFEKFRTEARTIARLEHPHIVRVLDFGIDGYTPYLVMAYAPNGTLRQRHPRGTRLSLATIIPYVRQVANALQYAHQLKLIHRDIKPENMLLGRHGEVLLSDFGFVLIAQSSISQSTKEMAGTMPYMAPEQLQGKPRAASDQYALGVVVYEWLAGDRPFQGSVLEIATQHMTRPPVSLRSKNPAIPPEVEEVVFTALAKDPQQRFATVQAFATALEQASNIVSPIASTSTLSLEEVSALPPIGTQSLSFLTPAEPAHNIVQTFQTRAIEENFIDARSPDFQHLSNMPGVSKSHSLRRIPRRAVLLGLAGVAIGSAASNGIWLAKSAGLFAGASSTALILPLPGTTLYTYTRHKGSVLTAVWSRDGYRLASGSADNTVQVWDAATGWRTSSYLGHKDWVWSVAWSPDGNYIASGGGSYDKTVQVWNVASKRPVDTFDSTEGVNSVAWSPDGKLIASGSYDKLVVVRDPFNHTNPFTLQGHTDGVKSVAWSPDGKLIASGSLDQTVIVWDASNGNHLYTLPHNNYIKSVAWSPDSKYIASSTGDTASQGNGEHLVYIWDAPTRKLVNKYYGHHEEVATVTWSPDGKRIASAGGNLNSGEGDTSVQIWDAFSGNQVLAYTRHHKMVNSVAWAPEGSRIASASRDMTVHVWKS